MTALWAGLRRVQIRCQSALGIAFQSAEDPYSHSVVPVAVLRQTTPWMDPSSAYIAEVVWRSLRQIQGERRPTQKRFAETLNGIGARHSTDSSS